jgi:hypothetical protein
LPLAGWEPDYVTEPDVLDWAAFALDPATAGRDYEGLAKRMGMPCSPRAGFEGDAGTLNKRRIGRLEERIDSDCASEPIRWSVCRRLGASSFDTHFLKSFQKQVSRNNCRFRYNCFNHAWFIEDFLPIQACEPTRIIRG